MENINAYYYYLFYVKQYIDFPMIIVAVYLIPSSITCICITTNTNNVLSLYLYYFYHYDSIVGRRLLHASEKHFTGHFFS